MILNPIICKACGNGLQVEDIGMRSEGDNLIRICLFCKDEVVVR